MNVSHVLPWDLNPALAQDRLATIARVAVSTRNQAFAEADRASGDTNWGLACKAHERLMFALGRLAGSGEHPWLTVIREGLYVMPLVEGVPVRLYHGAADRPGSRHLDAVRLEHERCLDGGSASRADEGGDDESLTSKPRPQMAFDFMAAPPAEEDGPWYWLMALETDERGMVSRVVVVQANDAGETRHPWECPLDLQHADETVSPKGVQLALVDPVAVTMGDPERVPQTPPARPAPSVRPAPSAPPASPAQPEGPPRRGRRPRVVPAVRDLRQEGLWSAALGAE